MTTSKAPWTTAPVNADTSMTVEIRDATGKRIGFFLDYRDAELVIESANKIAELQEEVEKLEDRLAALIRLRK